MRLSTLHHKVVCEYHSSRVPVTQRGVDIRKHHSFPRFIESAHPEPKVGPRLRARSFSRVKILAGLAVAIWFAFLPGMAFAATNGPAQLVYKGSRIQSKAGSGISPDSVASGCNLAVCIDVNGSGNNVNRVQGNGTATHIGCAHGHS